MTVHERYTGVCNLSRIPFHIDNNPLYQTCLEYEQNKELTFEESSLFNHYKKEKPKNLAEFYGIKSLTLEKYAITNIFLPWHHTHPVKKYSDNAFIKQDNEHIEQQFKKLISLYTSIKEFGYIPEKYPSRRNGHITGYYLNYGIISRFFVVSGNHRIAAINAAQPKNTKFSASHEKFEFMKPRDKQNCGFLNLKEYPSQFNIETIFTWPAVRNGFLRVSEAAAIFETYIYS